MYQRPINAGARFHFERFFNQGHGVAQTRSVIPMDVTQALVAFHRVPLLFLQKQPDSRINGVFYSVPSGAEGVGS
jgi:hypothetical protein